MRITLKSLNVALLALGCGSLATVSLAESRYYDPSNAASNQGKTTNYELYRTIGCPGQGLFEKNCIEETPAPVAKKAPPAPACPLPAGAVTGDKVPSGAKAGECYAKVAKPATFRTEATRKLVKEAGERIETVPAKYETVKEKVLVKEASERIEILPPVYKAVKVRVQSEEIQEVVPAVYETVKEKVLVKEASTRLEEVPAVYETVEEKVLVKPASRKAIEVPAVYETVTEKKLVREAYTTWKPGTQTNIQKVDTSTGQIMCLVEVPAEYQDVTRQVVKSPATVRYEDIPAEYQTVKKTVLKSAAATRTVQIPAEYAEREVKKLVKPATTVTKVVPVDYEREIMTVVQPATEKRIPIPAEYAEREVTKLVAAAKEVRVPVPAEYADVPKEVLVCPVQEYWVQVLCDVNATPAKVTDIQKALKAAGFDPGSANGQLDAATMKAVADFQKSKGLAQDGYVSVETVRALGLTPN
ncbi:MAG: peptidoglycan-binding protein [Pseudomonadota bacterium]